MVLLQTLTRLLAFIGKELVEVVRRPGAVLSLIVGPFLIMALFGSGYTGIRPPLRTVLVVPPEAGLPTDVATYQEMAPGLDIQAVVPDAEPAQAQLRDRAIDVVVIAPQDAAARFEAGEQSTIEVHVNTVDPVAQAHAGFLAATMASEVNKRIIEEAASEGERYALGASQTEIVEIEPKVIAAPTRAELANAAPIDPSVVSFFGPAVLALILQHMAVTLVALSLVRERTTGIIELFRISPITTTEVIVGKILAFGILAAGIGAATIAVLAALGVPMLGDPLYLAGALALLLVASLGLGILIAVISDSERQAVQLALLVLLASVFFGGFVLSVDEFTPPVRTIAYLLPVTHGIRLAQDVMLHGWTNAPWHATALIAIAAVLLVGSWALLRRGMTRV
jgi:ABC-2 type transport system permease protein